jgi:hypothetical protein
VPNVEAFVVLERFEEAGTEGGLYTDILGQRHISLQQKLET